MLIKFGTDAMGDHLRDALFCLQEVVDPNSRFEYDEHDTVTRLLQGGTLVPGPEASALADLIRQYELPFRYYLHEGWGKSKTLVEVLLERLEPGRDAWALLDPTYNYLPSMAC